MTIVSLWMSMPQQRPYASSPTGRRRTLKSKSVFLSELPTSRREPHSSVPKRSGPHSRTASQMADRQQSFLGAGEPYFSNGLPKALCRLVDLGKSVDTHSKLYNRRLSSPGLPSAVPRRACPKFQRQTFHEWAQHRTAEIRPCSSVLTI